MTVAAATLLLSLGVFSHSQAQVGDNRGPVGESGAESTLQCRTCAQGCEALGLERGERYCTGPEGLSGGVFKEDKNARHGLVQAQQPDQQPGQQLGSPSPRLDQIQVSSVTWTFLPIIELLAAEGYISPVQAQQTLQGQAQRMLECFSPRDYQARGHLTVDLHLTYIGAPQGVRGMTEGIAPRQARCILAQSWGYTFPAPTDPEPDTAHVRYRVSFLADQEAAESLDPSRPQLLVERVMVEEEEISEETLSRELAIRAFDVRQCQIIALDELPSDLIVADVEMDFRRRTGLYQATNVDITLINETSSTLPPAEMVECVRQALSVWYADLPEAEVDTFKSRFFLTFRPATTM